MLIRVKFALLSLISSHLKWEKDGETGTSLTYVGWLKWIEAWSAMKGYFSKMGIQENRVGIFVSFGLVKNKF